MCPLLDGTFGVEFQDINLQSGLSRGAQNSIFDAVAEYGLAVLRRQAIMTPKHRKDALGLNPPSNKFGAQYEKTVHEFEVGALNVDVGFQWHAEGVLLVSPPPITSLQCVDVETSSETVFADGKTLYAGLPQELRREADKAMLRYCKWTTLPGTQRRLRGDGLRLSAGVPAPGPREAIISEHPLVRWTHGMDGIPRCGIYAVPAFLHSIRFVGGRSLEPEKSRDWLASMLETAGLGTVGLPASYLHRWGLGDLLFWDTRRVLYRTLPPQKWAGARLHHHRRLPGAEWSEGPACAAELEEALSTWGPHGQRP